MTKRLLDRQASLLAYLTSSNAIFGGTDDVPLDPALRGIDRNLLRIEARFSHQKRLEKIVAVFPRTFELLGADRDAIVRDFAATCPPTDIGRFENARQFAAFLAGRWQQAPPTPPYLPDVAACEFAGAMARAAADDAAAAATSDRRGRELRRRPGVVLHRAAFDIRTIFGTDGTGREPIRRDTPLAVVVTEAGEPRIFGFAPQLFDLLAALDGWVDAAQFDSLPDAAGLAAELVEAGLLEVRG